MIGDQQPAANVFPFRLLFQYLNEEAGIDSASITFELLKFDLLKKFFDWLASTRKNSRTTIKQRIGALSSFAEYAKNRNLEAGFVFRNSLTRISKKSFRRAKGKPRCAFARQEIEILFLLPDTTDRIGWRDIVLLAVMYASGARAQEICDLTVKDVSHDSNGTAILTLLGKGEKSRRVKITADATEMLDKYIAYRKIGDQLTRHVFSARETSRCPCHVSRKFFQSMKKWQRTRILTSSDPADIPRTSCGIRPPHIF